MFSDVNILYSILMKCVINDSRIREDSIFQKHLWLQEKFCNINSKSFFRASVTNWHSDEICIFCKKKKKNHFPEIVFFKQLSAKHFKIVSRMRRNFLISKFEINLFTSETKSVRLYHLIGNSFPRQWFKTLSISFNKFLRFTAFHA